MTRIYVRKIKKNLANIITMMRVVLSLPLLLSEPLSPSFYILYCLCGLSDMVDGFVARRTNSESRFGERIDSLADIVFVAMVLSALRLMDSGRITENVECNDVDFDTTMKIIKVISTHNDYIFNVLDKERPEGIAVADSYSSATRKAIISALPGYFTTEDMKKVAANVGKSLRTVRRQIARAIEAGEIQQVKHGEYKKM